MSKHQTVFWTTEEKQAVRDEGVRLWRTADRTTSLAHVFREAQSVLPKTRRREVSTVGKVPWFTEALKGALKPQNGPQSGDRSFAAPPPHSNDSALKQDHRSLPRVHWKDDEKRALCFEAAKLLHGLEANGPRDALMKAQLIALPPERRRKLPTMTDVAGWYPAGLMEASQALRKAKEAAAATAEPVQATAEAIPAPTPQAPAPEAIETVQAAVELAPPSPSTPLTSMLGSPWAALREHLVMEVASIVAEGILRGLESVNFTAPKTSEQAQTPPVPHVPFVREPAKPRLPSVLVVGLRGGQAPQIEADFAGKLDLRFCSSDKSKDQLRSMTEQADTTVAVTDFLSHSHTDIIKARSKHYIESAGGMTSLRQQLARIAGLHLNGQAQA